jgi:hypothetical protein
MEPKEKGQAMTSPDKIERPELNPSASQALDPYWAREHLPKVCIYALAQEARISALEAKLEEAEGKLELMDYRRRAAMQIATGQSVENTVLDSALKGDDNE